MFVTVALHTAEGLDTLNIPASWVLFTREIREDKGFGFSYWIFGFSYWIFLLYPILYPIISYIIQYLIGYSYFLFSYFLFLIRYNIVKSKRISQPEELCPRSTEF